MDAEATDTSAYDNSNSVINTGPGKTIASPFAENDTHARVGVLVKYMRDNAAGLVPGLRDPAGWLTGSLRAIEDEFGLRGGGAQTSANANDGPSLLSQIFMPVQALMQAPDPHAAEALWVTPSYHHKGFLPFNDAMMLGVGLRHGMFGDRVSAEVHPFYAQNWVSDRGYYGAEMAVTLGPQFGLSRPIGKIALRYVEGDSDLMDHGHGFDLHSEMRFTDQLSLNAGMHQDENSDLGNYVMLRWKLTGWN